MSSSFIFQNLINALQWGSFYAIISLGYSMVYSILMLFNFAHGDIFMTGTYIALWRGIRSCGTGRRRLHLAAALSSSSA